MSTTTKTELKELKDLINNRFNILENEQVKISEQIKDIGGQQVKISEQIKNIEIGQARIEEKLVCEVKRLDDRLNTFGESLKTIPNLAEKVGEMKNWRQIALVFIGGVIGGIMTWIFKK